MKKMTPALILSVYVIVRFGFTQWLDSLGDSASYIFEVIFVLAVGVYYRNRIRFSIPFPKELGVGFIPALLLGAASYLGLRPLGLIAPFDLHAIETILLLVLIGPVLEELIFRMALWEPLVDFIGDKSPLAVLLVTSLIFAYAHFHAFWFTPNLVHPFIIYQTVYVLFLAIYCGYRKMKTGSISSPILVHIGFNAGFFLASLL